MKYKITILMLISLVLAGCASNPFQLGEISAPRYDFTLIDERSEISKNGGKESWLDTFLYHGDDMFVPDRTELFKSTVTSAYESAPKKVILNQFDVIDSHANRIGAAQAAGLASISPAASAAVSGKSNDKDFIVCIIKATVDGKEIIGSAIATYQLEAFGSAIVYGDPQYISAVQSAVSEALKLWKEEAKK